MLSIQLLGYSKGGFIAGSEATSWASLESPALGFCCRDLREVRANIKRLRADDETHGEMLRATPTALLHELGSDSEI